MLTETIRTQDTNTILMFVGLGVLGFFFAALLKREDAKDSGFGLELPEKT